MNNKKILANDHAKFLEKILQASIEQLDKFCNGDTSEVEVVKYKIEKDD